MSKVNAACQTDETVFSQIVSMDTDEDESEIDDGEEEERVKRHHHRPIVQVSNRREIVPTVQINREIDTEKRKKAKIELRLPQTLDQPRVCCF